MWQQMIKTMINERNDNKNKTRKHSLSLNLCQRRSLSKCLPLQKVSKTFIRNSFSSYLMRKTTSISDGKVEKLILDPDPYPD